MYSAKVRQYLVLWSLSIFLKPITLPYIDYAFVVSKAATRIYFREVLGDDTATARPEGGGVLEEGTPPPS